MGKKRRTTRAAEDQARIAVPIFKKECRTLEGLEAEFKRHLQATIDLGHQSGIEMSDGGNDYDQLLLRHGKMYQGRLLSDSVPAWKRWKKNVKPQLQDCFCNAASFAVDHEQASYFEGYWLGPLPALHAWNMVDGQIIDFTLELVEKKLKRKPDLACLYFGVQVPTIFVAEQIASTEEFAQVADLYLQQMDRPRKRRPPSA
ncbi:MAG: hypothetical protein WAN65_03485 [Candidatus Sulfotelmatobacter sp.]